ncbi:lytic transglycosylase domain-containing protein [Bradyrhizobium sp. HKCCYLS3077]|uniref:lytic transglycosylase domain-containing protein n=1 Tax=Bradyrhizobium sp. HKCCYLS3077 TaxID=3420761 RepID=UPI003EBEC0B9
MRVTSMIVPRDWRAQRAEYRDLIEREASAAGMPAAIVDAVMAVESSYDPTVIGLDGEIGLMQVMPSTARMLGFSGTREQLAEPAINIRYGTKYLAGAWRLAGGDLCTAAMKYRAGHGETRFSHLSVIYCVRIRSHLAAQGVQVSGDVPQATFGRSVPTPPAAGSGYSRPLDMASLNMRLRVQSSRSAIRPVP